MDSEILKSIQTKRKAIYDYYDLPPEERRRAEAIFTLMELLGKECRNSSEFEERFHTMTLNREYNNLFVEFTAYTKTPDNIPTKEDYAKQVTKDYTESIVLKRTEVKTRYVTFNAISKKMDSLFNRRKKRKNVKTESDNNN